MKIIILVLSLLYASSGITGGTPDWNQVEIEIIGQDSSVNLFICNEPGMTIAQTITGDLLFLCGTNIPIGTTMSLTDLHAGTKI